SRTFSMIFFESILRSRHWVIFLISSGVAVIGILKVTGSPGASFRLFIYLHHRWPFKFLFFPAHAFPSAPGVQERHQFVVLDINFRVFSLALVELFQVFFKQNASAADIECEIEIINVFPDTIYPFVNTGCTAMEM